MRCDRLSKMNKLKLASVLAGVLVFLSGCSHQYLIKLSNGDQILSSTKPKIHGTNYLFTDDSRVHYVIPRSRVAKIRPVKVEKEAAAPTPADPAVNQQRPKRWYFLWLA